MDLEGLPEPVREELRSILGERASNVVGKVRMVDGGSHWFLMLYAAEGARADDLSALAQGIRARGIGANSDGTKVVVPAWRKPNAIGDA